MTGRSEKTLLSQYVSGFILSVVLTVGAYLLVQIHINTGKSVLASSSLLVVLLLFALAQLVVQLYFFLHVTQENRPRWRLLTLLLAAVMVGILVIGSIWIMANLNYHMPASPQQTNSYLQSQDSL